MREMFTFDDVLIVPKFSKIESRKQVDLNTSLRNGLPFSLPVISANMDTITGSDMAKAMLEYGGQACLHRFGTVDETITMFAKSVVLGPPQERPAGRTPMVSVGLGSSELERAETLASYGAETIVIDVAHGAQISVVKQVKALREILGSSINIVVGNFASADSVQTFLEYTGTDVDAFKVGIGPGSACTTRIKTGVGVPQLSAIVEIVRLLKNTGIPVIADGGMKTPGDIAKALGAGAKAVMLGGMLSGTWETPGETVTADGVPCKSKSFGSITGVFKKYRGSASLESYIDQGKDARHRTAEGESFLVPYKGPVNDVLQDIEGGLRSAFTYVGASNLEEFHRNVEFVKISGSTLAENGAHGKKK